MRTRFKARGIMNEIQQVGVSGMIQSRGIENILSVQFGSDKNHLSVDQNNRQVEVTLHFRVQIFLEKRNLPNRWSNSI